MVRVVLAGVDGVRLELEASATQLVRDLKLRVAQRCPVPVECQRLVRDTTVLRDTDQLVAHIPEGGDSLTLTLVVSLDEVQRSLAKGDKSARISSLRALARVGSTKGGCDASVELIGACVGDPDPGVRRTATQTLLQVAGRGHVGAVKSVCAHLESNDAAVRAAGVLALPQVAEKGDPDSVVALCSRLEDRDPEVRRLALAMLPALAASGDAYAAAAVTARLKDPNPDVRWAVVEALPRVLGKGDPRGLAAVREHLVSTDLGTRVRAVQMLPLVVELGNSEAFTVLKDCLRDDEHNLVVVHALEVLPQLVTRGDPRALAVARTWLEKPDASKHVQRAAQKAMELVAA